MNKEEVLQATFGYTAFREGQEALIDTLLAGRDAVGIMPTGGGKSVCYQVPALMLPGTALVISPLISLMKDQVAALKAAGVPAAFLNSTLTPSQQNLALQRAREGQYKLIYVAPERLDTPSFRSFASSSPISLIAVDEAHCVSQWGQDFRPNYLRIAAFIESLPTRPPVGAFTATATQRVRDDMVRLLGLHSPSQVITGFDRPNLYYEIIPVKRHREHVLYSVLSELQGRSGIVYCATRKTVETVCDRLRSRGLSATRYHAGLEEDERRQNQEDFQYDRAQIMVATNAFGMGIDKSNVGFVIHYNMPKSVEAYYQEAGRAGRDGSEADCVLLFSMQDVVTARRLILDRTPNAELTPEQQEEVTRQDLRRLQDMIRLCEQPGCIRQALLRYFGQPAGQQCGHCSHCTQPRYPEAYAIGQMEKIDLDTRRKLRHAGNAEQTILPQIEESTALRPGSEEAALFERLRACRMDIARERGVPPYVICHDRTLRDMAQKRPRNLDELDSIYGLGRRKIADFGIKLLTVITGQPVQNHVSSTDLSIPQESNIPTESQILMNMDSEQDDSSWTREEIQQLRDSWYFGHPMREIADALGRDRAEVLLKADDLGLLAPKQ